MVRNLSNSIPIELAVYPNRLLTPTEDATITRQCITVRYPDDVTPIATQGEKA